MSDPLSDDEIRAMTRPLKQAAAQVRYLRKIGIKAERKPDGTVLVMPEWLLAQNGPVRAKSKFKLQSDIKREQAEKTS